MDNDKGAARLLVHADKGRKVFSEISDDFRSIQSTPEKMLEGTAEMTKSIQYNYNVR